MPSSVYKGFKHSLLNNTVNFEHTIMVALMDEFHYFSDSHEVFSDVQACEIAEEKGYCACGKPLKNVTVTREPHGIMIDADNVIWEKASFDCQHIVLYFKETQYLISSYDLLYNRGGSGELFTLLWHKRGLIYDPAPDDPPQYLKRYLDK